jgi:zinc protease
MLWLTLAAFAAPPAPPPAAPDPSADLATHPSTTVLPNGLTVILEENHRTDTVALHLSYGVGSRDEKPGELGCAHLFEHLMFEGSEHVPNNAFDKWLTAAGGDNNAFTNEDETAYHMTFPSGATDLALFLESDRMGFLLAGVTDESVANQRKVVLQERAEDYAEPNGRDWDALSRLMWPDDHLYHHPVLGTVSDVQGFTAAGTKAFWTEHYRPRNAILAIVGNFDSADALAKVTAWFADVPDPGPAPARANDPAKLGWPGRTGYLEDDVQQRTLYLAFPTVPLGHPDEPALDLLANVLSHGRGTRIDDRLYYDSTMATSAFAYANEQEIGGQFVFGATSPDTPFEMLARTLQQEVNFIYQGGTPTAAELDRARQAEVAGWLDALEDPASRAELLVDCKRHTGRPDCLVDEWKRYQAVKPEDLARVAKAYLSDEARRTVLYVVPRGDTKSFPLGVEPVELP